MLSLVVRTNEYRAHRAPYAAASQQRRELRGTAEVIPKQPSNGKDNQFWTGSMSLGSPGIANPRYLITPGSRDSGVVVTEPGAAKRNESARSR